MTHETDAGDTTARTIKGIDLLNSVFQTRTVQGRLEPDNVAVERLDGDADAVEAAAARLQQLGAIVFGGALIDAPAPLPGYFNPGTGEYAVEGTQSSGEWLVADLDSIALTEAWR